MEQSAPSVSSSQAKGLTWGFISYALWGFFPIYWKFLEDRSAFEVLAHRVIWSFVFYSLVFTAFSTYKWSTVFIQSRRDWFLSALASALLAINWGNYIYAVNTNRILEGSLAYFINPILNVAVGVLFFKEPFPPILKLSVGFAFLGVIAKIMYSPGFPWIALVLAFTFCVYGIAKKLLKIPAITSSVVEAGIALLPALIAAAYFQVGEGAQAASATTWGLFIFSGVVTGLPLFLFSYAAQLVPYSIMGMLQFVAPTLQFLVAVVLYGEEFGTHNAVAFGLIWIGIGFYVAHQFLRCRINRAANA